jgi:hypothetical protein
MTSISNPVETPANPENAILEPSERAMRRRVDDMHGTPPGGQDGVVATGARWRRIRQARLKSDSATCAAVTPSAPRARARRHERHPFSASVTLQPSGASGDIIIA